MRIDSKVEQTTRDLLDHAMKGELAEIPRIIGSINDDRIVQDCLKLCVMIAGYAAIEICGAEWPNEKSLRKISANTANAAKSRFRVDETEVYAFLDSSALRFRPLSEIYPTQEEAMLTPFLITASMLVTYGPKDKTVWEYLDQIEGALEASAALDASILPALILRTRMPAGTD